MDIKNILYFISYCIHFGLQAQCHFELQMLKSFDIKNWIGITTNTAMESRNQVVIYGRRDMFDPWSLYTFQNNLDGEIAVTRMNAPCHHHPVIPLIGLVTVVQNGEEMLVMSCDLCKDMKLVDRVMPIFKSPKDPLGTICWGPNGGLFVALQSGNVQQLDNSFSITNTFDFSSFFTDLDLTDYLVVGFTPMCYLRAPHNALIVNNRSELRAISLLDGRQVWKDQHEGFIPYCLLYCPQQGIILITDELQPQVRILNPFNGSVIQTIEIPNIDQIQSICLLNGQIVMIQEVEEEGHRRRLSYYNLENHFH